MQVEINKQDSILLPPMGHITVGADEKCDIVLNFENGDNSKNICSLIHDRSACIIEVFNNENVFVNGIQIKEMSILHPGDVIIINNQLLRLVEENKLPKNCSAAFKVIEQSDINNLLVTSVSGLRSFNPESNGKLEIVGNQNSFTHKPINGNDIPFSVSYVDEELTLLCKKGEKIRINGNQASYVILKNGDFITTDFAKYCVESPGTSSFSKYSPSHPRNIQLSEEYFTDNTKVQESSNDYIKNNLWWITLLGGLIVIAIILFVLKKP